VRGFATQTRKVFDAELRESVGLRRCLQLAQNIAVDFRAGDGML
jgi:hypothetical protein